MGEAWPKDAQNERFKSSRGEKASESVILRTQMKTLDAERRAILSAYDADRLQTDLVHSPFDGIRNCYSTFIHFQGTSKLKTSLKIILNCACGLLLNIYNTVWSSWWIFEFTIHTLSNLQWKPATNETRQETPAIGCKTHDSSEMLSDGNWRLV